MSQELIDINVIWNGDNFIEIIRVIALINTEVKVKVQGKRLCIRDDKVGFYNSVIIGDTPKIPEYFRSIVIDKPVEYVEPVIEETAQCVVSTELSDRMMMEWGLIPQRKLE